MSKKILVLAAALMAMACSDLRAQTTPGFTTGQVPSAAQWNGYFGAKQDYFGTPAAIATSGSASDLIAGTVPSARLPIATTGAVGGVKVDGTTILISGGVISAPGTGVSSFNTRTGAVVPTTGDYTFAQIGSLPTTVSGYGITDALTLTGIQTATNKTLTSPTINGGALSGTFTGTPVLNLTSATSLPISTGVSGLGTGVATFLATPSGANLASALTSALPISKGGTGLTSAAVATLTALGGLTGTPSSTTMICGNGTWCTPAGSGTVNAGTLGQLAYYAAAGSAVSGVGPGTATTLLHGNASGAPSFSAVDLANDVTGKLSTANLSNSQNAQTSTTYTIVAGDGGKTVVRSNASAMTDTLPQAGTTGFTAGFGFREMNKGTAALTLNTTTSLFPNGASSLILQRGQGADLASDGTDYSEVMVGVPVMGANTILGNISGTNYPAPLSTANVVSMLSAAVTNAGQTFSGLQVNAVTTLTIATATFTPDGSNNNYKIGLTSACPCTIANPSVTPVAGTSGVIEIDQDGTGSRTIGTWGSQYVTPGGTSTLALSTAASAKDIFSYYVIDATHILVTPGALNAIH